MGIVVVIILAILGVIFALLGWLGGSSLFDQFGKILSFGCK